METPIEQPWVAICTPSRGLVFSELIDYIENVRSTYPHIRWFTTHNLPIPDCFNNVSEQALRDPKYQYIWFIEEDTIPPIKALDKLLEAMQTSPIAGIDYGFNGGYNTIVRSSVTDSILFMGFGCTMMKREVLEKFDKPIFRADKSFNISSLQWYPVDASRVYGQYDIIFGSEARKKGFTFYQVPDMECRHLQLMQLGQKEINNGCHVITEKDRISKTLTLPLRDL